MSIWNEAVKTVHTIPHPSIPQVFFYIYIYMLSVMWHVTGVCVCATEDENGQSVVAIGCLSNNAQLVGRLIEAKGDASTVNTKGESALYVAMHRGSADLVNLLLEHGTPCGKT